MYSVHSILGPNAEFFSDFLSYSLGALNLSYLYSTLFLLGLFTLSFAIFVQRTLGKNNPIDIWRSLEVLPTFFQKYIFTRLLWLRNPFSKLGHIYVHEYERGMCICKVKETSSLQNPFHSLHAAELVLLGETSAALALFSVLGQEQRAIVTEINAKFFKKARGVVMSLSKCNCTYESETHVISELREGSVKGALLAAVVVIFAVASKETKKVN